MNKDRFELDIEGCICIWNVRRGFKEEENESNSVVK